MLEWRFESVTPVLHKMHLPLLRLVCKNECAATVTVAVNIRANSLEDKMDGSKEQTITFHFKLEVRIDRFPSFGYLMLSSTSVTSSTSNAKLISSSF